MGVWQTCQAKEMGWFVVYFYFVFFLFLWPLAVKQKDRILSMDVGVTNRIFTLFHSQY